MQVRMMETVGAMLESAPQFAVLGAGITKYFQRNMMSDEDIESMLAYLDALTSYVRDGSRDKLIEYADRKSATPEDPAGYEAVISDSDIATLDAAIGNELENVEA